MSGKSDKSIEKPLKDRGKEEKNVKDPNTGGATRKGKTPPSSPESTEKPSEDKGKRVVQLESDNSISFKNKTTIDGNTSIKNTVHGESTSLATPNSGSSWSSIFNSITMFLRSEMFVGIAKRVWLTLLCEVIVSFISRVGRNYFKSNTRRVSNQHRDPSLTPYKPVFVLANGDTGLVNKSTPSTSETNGPTQVPGISVDEFIRQLSLAARKTSSSGRDLKSAEHSKKHKENNDLAKTSHSVETKLKDEVGSDKRSKPDSSFDDFSSNLADVANDLAESLKNSAKQNHYQSEVSIKEKDHETTRSNNVVDNKNGVDKEEKNSRKNKIATSADEGEKNISLKGDVIGPADDNGKGKTSKPFKGFEKSNLSKNNIATEDEKNRPLRNDVPGPTDDDEKSEISKPIEGSSNDNEGVEHKMSKTGDLTEPTGNIETKIAKEDEGATPANTDTKPIDNFEEEDKTTAQNGDKKQKRNSEVDPTHIKDTDLPQHEQDLQATTESITQPTESPIQDAVTPSSPEGGKEGKQQSAKHILSPANEENDKKSESSKLKSEQNDLLPNITDSNQLRASSQVPTESTTRENKEQKDGMAEPGLAPSTNEGEIQQNMSPKPIDPTSPEQNGKHRGDSSPRNSSPTVKDNEKESTDTKTFDTESNSFRKGKLEESGSSMDDDITGPLLDGQKPSSGISAILQPTGGEENKFIDSSAQVDLTPPVDKGKKSSNTDKSTGGNSKHELKGKKKKAQKILRNLSQETPNVEVLTQHENDNPLESEDKDRTEIEKVTDQRVKKRHLKIK